MEVSGDPDQEKRRSPGRTHTELSNACSVNFVWPLTPPLSSAILMIGRLACEN